MGEFVITKELTSSKQVVCVGKEAGESDVFIDLSLQYRSEVFLWEIGEIDTLYLFELLNVTGNHLCH